MHIYAFFAQIAFKVEQVAIFWPLIRGTLKHYPYLAYHFAKYFAAFIFILAGIIFASVCVQSFNPYFIQHGLLTVNIPQTAQLNAGIVSAGKYKVGEVVMALPGTLDISKNLPAARNFIWQSTSDYFSVRTILPELCVAMCGFILLRRKKRQDRQIRYISMVERLAAIAGLVFCKTILVCERILLLTPILKLKFRAQAIILRPAAV